MHVHERVKVIREHTARATYRRISPCDIFDIVVKSILYLPPIVADRDFNSARNINRLQRRISWRTERSICVEARARISDLSPIDCIRDPIVKERKRKRNLVLLI